MAHRKALLLLAALLGGAAILGCGADENGSAPLVKVSSEQRAKDLDGEAESTIKWLEGMAPAERQATIAKSPSIKGTLDGASDPALKARIAALGLSPTKP